MSEYSVVAVHMAQHILVVAAVRPVDIPVDHGNLSVLVGDVVVAAGVPVVELIAVEGEHGFRSLGHNPPVIQL